jgi:hypothetical protein
MKRMRSVISIWANGDLLFGTEALIEDSSGINFVTGPQNIFPVNLYCSELVVQSLIKQGLDDEADTVRLAVHWHNIVIMSHVWAVKMKRK